MTEEGLGKIYRIIRIAIFAIPIFVTVVGIYVILFPIDSYNFYAKNPNLSKFEIVKNSGANQLMFGVFPTRDYRYIKLSINLEENEKNTCDNLEPEISLIKTYRAYQYPEADSITSEDQLKNFLFRENKAKYPNGSLLHLKTTNEVFIITRGKKILFPGPEIFQAFGYNFDNLAEVEQSDIDQFPDADQKFFSWVIPHPDGTIFQAFPSHSLYLVFDGKKYPIENKELLAKVWPENFTIPVSDFNQNDILKCSPKEKIFCRFDGTELSGIGRYYSFSVNFPDKCPVENIYLKNSRIRFVSERSFSTAKESLKNIAASVLNRYFYKQ